MTAAQQRPAIIGSGLTGMVVSDHLSRAGVPHVLIGDSPNDNPRLGESLDAAGTIGLLATYPDFDEYYHKKRGISVFTGQFATTCDFGETVARSVGLRLMGFQSPPELIDVDRIGFDRALYEQVTASDHCTRVESLVDTVEYNHQTDVVESIHLENGSTLEPDYVFDCTNFARLLGRTLDIPVDWISAPQRVVFTDYHAPSDARTDGQLDEVVRDGDHLVRLYADIDGLDGLAWAIPLDSYVSVGVSLPGGKDAPESDEVLSRVEDAYRRRGMDLLDRFDRIETAVDIPRQRYFIHERAFGQNWLLAGPAYGQFWFPTASGVATSLVAAYLAPQFLDSPSLAGRRYQDYVDGIRETHHIFDRVINLNPDEITKPLLKSETNRIIAENVKRVGLLSIIQNGPLASGVAWLFMKVARYDGVVEGDCEVYNAELADQAELLFAHE